jgi:hypothetical protein
MQRSIGLARNPCAFSGIEKRQEMNADAISAERLLQASSPLGLWAYPDIESINELARRVRAHDEIVVNLQYFDEVTFVLNSLFVGEEGVTVLVGYDEGNTRYLFTIHFKDVQIEDDQLGSWARLSMVRSPDGEPAHLNPETESFGFEVTVQKKFITEA